MVTMSAPSSVAARHEAGIDAPAVEDDRAGAALAAVAALLGPGEAEPVAQKIEQRDAGVVERDVAPRAVDRRRYRKVHAKLRCRIEVNRCSGSCITPVDRVTAKYGGILRFATAGMDTNE